MLAGILVIGKYTYGGPDDKTYYKCHVKGEEYLVKYKLKYDTFNKKYTNMYVLIEPERGPEIETETEPGQKFAKLVETLGPVDDINAFNRYQMHHYNLVRKKIDFNSVKLDFTGQEGLKDLRDQKIYTIDSKETRDFDDAFSFRHLNDVTILSIHIINVAYYLQKYKIIDNFREMIDKILSSSVYLQDQVISMFPKNMVSEYFTLKKNSTRICLTLELYIDKNGKIFDQHLYNSILTVTNNLLYTDSNDITKKLVHLVNIIDNKVSNNHEAIEFMMIYMNRACANYIEGHGPIYRISTKNTSSLKEYFEFYSEYSFEPNKHILFNSLYIHITSPIRRIVDLINMCKINIKMDCYENNFVNIYLNYDFVERINVEQKLIKKVQTRSQLLYLFQNEKDKIYDGTVVIRNDNIYDILLKDIKLISKCKILDSTELIIGQQYKFKIFVFENESNFNKKVKLQLFTG
jgi:hypothetical protein